MDNFNVIINKQTIEIVTEPTTKWYCFASGNFSLSQYTGIGSATINIVAPPSVLEITGYVEFVVNSYHCSSKLRYNLNETNEDYLMVSPLNVNFTKKGEYMMIHVSSSKPWTVTSDTHIIVRDKINDSFYVESNSEDNYKITITVSNSSQSQIVTIQQKTKVIDDTCTLIVTKDPNVVDATVFQLNVISKKGNNFSPYKIVSKPNNITTNDDGLGTIFCSVIDLTKDCKGSITITNECGMSQTITVNYNGKIIQDEVFYISYNGREYVDVNITYSKNPFSWVGNDINLPYNKSYTFNIVSLDSNGNNVYWFPKSYNNDIIEVSSNQNTLSLLLLDYTENNSGESILLENNNGQHIVLNFKIIGGLIEVIETFFEIGLTEGNKSKNVTTDYIASGVIVYLDSYKTNNTDVSWNCNYRDNVVNYTVDPMNSIGGTNNKVTIMADESVLVNLEEAFVGAVTFQQSETFDTVTVNIRHTAISKVWKEVSSEITAITISPSIVTVPSCANEKSEGITVTGFHKIVERLLDDKGNSYGERTRYEERDITDIVTWNNPNADLVIRKENSILYVYSTTSNNYGNNDRIVNFTISISGLNGNLMATQPPAQQSDLNHHDMDAAIKKVFLEIEPILYEISGGVSTHVYRYADVDIKSYIIDSCGNVNTETEKVRSETFTTEVIVKQINKDTVSGFTISNDYTIITVDVNPWGYVFVKTDESIIELHFVDKDTPTQTVGVITKRNCLERIGQFVSEYTFSQPFATMTEQSPIVYLTQKGQSDKQPYILVSAPEWVIITMNPTSNEFISTIDVNVEKNKTKDERIGEIVFRQVDSNKEVIYSVRQDARGIIPIPDFNYLVLRYYWNIADGDDLDTATVFVNTGIEEAIASGGTWTLDNKSVGYSFPKPTTNVYPIPEKIITSPSNKVFLEFGGDNTQDGNESVWINFLEVCNEDNIETLPDEIYLDVYASWFAKMESGAIRIEISAYKGGTMIKDPSNPYNFINEGGTLSFNSIENTHVLVQGGSEHFIDYQTKYNHVAKVTYFKETQSAILQLLNE